MNTNEVLKLALGKIKSARDCHFAAIDTLLFEAEEILEEALAEQPAPMSQPNRVIAYSAATKLRELGYEWVDGAWKQPAQSQQEPQTHAQERTEFEQFWVDELGESDELTYGNLGYAIRRVDVAWEAWKAGKISANQQTIMGRKVWIDWKAQALELRELVRLNGIKIAELESAQPAQQEPVEWQHRKPIMDSEGNTRGYSDWLLGKGLEWWPHRALYTSPLARKPLTDAQIETVWRSVQANDFHDCVKPFARAIEAKLKEKNT